ncbi:hypothetical protein SMD11_1270 [Streptomyces albireticuli]|uniref:Uncharacterized protein n=1 Tax=Streptomyces albireticuli TaxID=1940 RepID=A0A1Z2KYC0_9ACTN|nr:hypothetical protein [Streptomyces albireticuli]ARZ66931.1 hypothetical protein SMD11_1270 [Streptomyces albireticuli]
MFEPMMCDTCCTPLEPSVSFVTVVVTYRHPRWVGHEWDHVPLPVPLDPSRLRGVCDFYSAGFPTTAFETVKAIVMQDGPFIRVFTEPWAACQRCAVHIRNRSPHLLIDRAVLVLPGTLNRPERQARRKEIKTLHMAFFQAEPEEVGL